MMLTHFNFAVKALPKTKEESSKEVKKADKKQAEESKAVKETAEPPAKKVFLITQKKAPGKTFYDIGIAVSTERGLVVPVIRDACQKSMAQLEKSIKNADEVAIPILAMNFDFELDVRRKKD